MNVREMRGSLLDAPAQVLVCPTNTVGVMGAGLAKAFSRRYAGILAPYQRACQSRTHTPAEPFAWPHPGGTVLCVATKRHWRDPSRLEDVDAAIRSMFAWVERTDAASIAVPALGCGHGGLSWVREVRPLLAAAVVDCAAEVFIYAPWPPPA